VLELSEYLHLPAADVADRFVDAAERFTDEWRDRVGAGTRASTLIRFYNESTTEIFDLARWHAEDPIHYRTLMCADIASRSPGRRMLDYGSGIGSDALVFADAGYEVTLADVSDPLRGFAKWRFERRGIAARSIDLKREPLPRRGFDVALCFDVLEHIPRPRRAVSRIGRALKPGGLLFWHAPFGEDSGRPMHVVHRDVITSRIRSIGFLRREDLERLFPDWLWAPRVWEAFGPTTLDRIGYIIHDRWLPAPIGAPIAWVYRRMLHARRPRLSG
jgi:SAM-dependent methyltransferase